jgi:hypothetical protein
MLPFCDRLVNVPRKDVAPVWTRSFPISKEPVTLGEHLKKKRFSAGIRQSEAAQLLGVSNFKGADEARRASQEETARPRPAKRCLKTKQMSNCLCKRSLSWQHASCNGFVDFSQSWDYLFSEDGGPS